jgi:hypothetical protein
LAARFFDIFPADDTLFFAITLRQADIADFQHAIIFLC